MVRLKQRYIFIEILQPPVISTKKNDVLDPFTTYSDKPSKALLTLHKPSPSGINPKTISNTLRQALQEYYGDFGASFAMQLNIKYFNNRTSTGIIRCGIQNFEYVLGALTVINEIAGYPVIIQSSHVSGTIKKCEEAGARRDRELMKRVTMHERMERGEGHTI